VYLIVKSIADQSAAPIWAANFMCPSASARSYDGRRNHDWGDHRGAPVAAFVPAVSTASAIWAAMEANTASASDLNDQTVLSLNAPNRHRWGGDC